MSNEVSTTLAGRNEEAGKNYPMVVEKVTLLGAIITYIFTFQYISGQFDTEWIGAVFIFTVYPFTLFFIIDMIGRLIQKMHNDA